MGLNQENRFFLFWSVLGAITVLITWHLPWRFQVNDDVIMMWLVSGAYTGEPESYLVFIHPYLSVFLASLYQNFPEFNWYGLLMFVGIGMGSFGLFWAIHKIDQSPEFKFFFSSLVYLVLVNLVFFVQFTLVAGWLALSGIFIFCYVRENSIIRGFALFLILFGLLVRWEAAVLVSMSFLGLIIYRLLVFHQIERKMLVEISLLCLVASLAYLSKLQYEEKLDADMKEYLLFNKQRSGVLDHPILFNKIQKESIVPGSDEFYLSRWLYEESPITMDFFKELESEYNREYFSLDSFIYSLKRFFYIQKKELLKSFVISVILVVSFLLPKRIVVFFVVPWILFYLVLNHFFLFYGRVNLLFFLVLMISWNHKIQLERGKRFLIILNFLIVLVLGIHGYNFYEDVKGRKEMTLEFDYLMEKRKSESLNLVEGIFPETLIKQYSMNNLVPFLHLGWLSRSPYQKKFLQHRFGKKSITEFDDYYLLAIKMPESIVYPDYMNLINPVYVFYSCVSGVYMELSYFRKYE